MQVQMGHNTSNLVDPISILNFLLMFKMTCDRNGVSEGAAIWLFYFLSVVRPHR